MELIVFVWLIAGYLVKNGVEDLTYGIRGKVPPRHVRHMKRLEVLDRTLNRSGTKKAPKPAKARPAREYFAGLYGDAFASAAERRRIKHEVRDPKKAEAYREKIEQRDGRRADRRQKRAERKANQQAAPTATPPHLGDTWKAPGPLPPPNKPGQDASAQAAKQLNPAYDDLWCNAYEAARRGSGRDDFALWFAERYADRYVGQDNPPSARDCAAANWDAWRAEMAKERGDRQRTKEETNRKPSGEANGEDRKPSRDQVWRDAFNAAVCGTGNQDFAADFAEKYADEFADRPDRPAPESMAPEAWQAWTAEHAKEAANGQPRETTPSATPDSAESDSAATDPATTSETDGTETAGNTPANGSAGNTPTQEGKPMTANAETTTLESTMAALDSWETETQQAITSLETSIASLEGEEVGPSVTGPIAEAQEAFGVAMAAFAKAKAALQPSVQIGDMYNGSPDAGSKQFVTS